WLSRGGAGVEVDLLDGEDGVSPGQACVFYDAPEGQARVLGGGFIQSAVAATHVPLMRGARVASGAERMGTSMGPPTGLAGRGTCGTCTRISSFYFIRAIEP